GYALDALRVELPDMAPQAQRAGVEKRSQHLENPNRRVVRGRDDPPDEGRVGRRHSEVGSDESGALPQLEGTQADPTRTARSDSIEALECGACLCRTGSQDEQQRRLVGPVAN